MLNRARFAGHAVHPMLVVFPLGLLSISVVFDVLGLVTRQPIWGLMAYWDMAAGLVGGVLAAIFGVIDLLGIPTGTRAARVALAHGILNVVVLGFFGVSLVVRALDRSLLPSPLAIGFSVTGLAIAVVSAWLGGELVERLGVGVSETANLDARSSLEDDSP